MFKNDTDPKQKLVSILIEDLLKAKEKLSYISHGKEGIFIHENLLENKDELLANDVVYKNIIIHLGGGLFAAQQTLLILESLYSDKDLSSSQIDLIKKLLTCFPVTATPEFIKNKRIDKENVQSFTDNLMPIIEAFFSLLGHIDQLHFMDYLNKELNDPKSKKVTH